MPSGNIQIAALGLTSPEQEVLNKKLMAVNDRIIPSLISIQSGKGDPERQEIDTLGNNLISGVRE